MMGHADDESMIMVVAQKPFEAGGNQFCRLIPLLYVDGTIASQYDFPNDGEIWWMLTPRTGSLAEPGQLVVGRLQDASGFDPTDPLSSRYQVSRDTVRPIDEKLGLEVLDIPPTSIATIEEVVANSYRLMLTHRPTPRVLVRWKGQVLGPFAATATVAGTGMHTMQVSFAAASPDMAVFSLPDEQFELSNDYLFRSSTQVSLTTDHASETHHPKQVDHVLLLRLGYERFLADSTERVVLEPIEQRLTRYARQLLVRRKRQELRHLLDELALTGRESEDAEQLLAIVSQLQANIDLEDAALDAVAKALLESGLLGEGRIRAAEETYAKRYVQDRAAELQAQMDEAISTRRQELQQIEGRLSDLQGRLQVEEERRRAELSETLAAERRAAEESNRAERDKLDRTRRELEHQQTILQTNLERVTTELREAGDEVVHRFLTIAPLLGLTGQVDGTRPPVAEKPATEAPRTAPFQLPPFVTSLSGSDEPVPELTFLDRLRGVVARSGFEYRELDLFRFHVSVKTGQLTVLGGPSGTGKSSLPLLYGRALQGEDAASGRPDCLMVPVNPSWMDVHDLLGHMNSLEGLFYPGETGLFEYLIWAQEEYQSRGMGTGMYVACLDEMNLSQVEHYFSDVMTVLERVGEHRALRAFSTEAASEACPFTKWSTINLSPALRFIGTVNVDETTRVLSDRFLDRTNLIQLQPSVLPLLSRVEKDALATADGRAITLGDFRAWQGTDALPTDLGLLLDEMRPILQRLGCPISPRVYRAMCRFIGSSAPLFSQSVAFDLQIAQRVAPRIRSLVTRRQVDAFDELRRLLEDNRLCTFEETLRLLDTLHEAALGADWLVED